MKIKQKQMILKMDGKFEWREGGGQIYVDLPAPRNVRYIIGKCGNNFHLDLIRLSNHGSDLCIGTEFKTLEDAKNRAELRESRYEVKKEAIERKHEIQ